MHMGEGCYMVQNRLTINVCADILQHQFHHGWFWLLTKLIFSYISQITVTLLKNIRFTYKCRGIDIAHTIDDLEQGKHFENPPKDISLFLLIYKHVISIFFKSNMFVWVFVSKKGYLTHTSIPKPLLKICGDSVKNTLIQRYLSVSRVQEFFF